MKQPLTAETMRGVWAALIVPWNHDDRPDIDRWEAEVGSYAGTGVRGVYTGGTTGEFYAQDDDTFDRITVTACRAAEAAGLAVQIGCTALSTSQVRRRIGVARVAGADAIQLALPFWLPLSDDEAVGFVKEAADAAGRLPLVLYDTERAKKRIGPDLLRRIVEVVPTVLGMKCTGCSLDELRALAAAAPQVAIGGGEHDLATKTMAGGGGTYSSVTGLNARYVARLYELAAAGRYDEARPMEETVRRYVFDLLIPMVREGLWDSAVDRVQRMAGGGDVGLRCAAPYRSATPEHVERLLAWCREHAPELLR
jgi:dihydrodipicolinate synthase/N-acetylneuraminate lyase